MVLVGATIVGSMATVWHGVVNPPRPGRLREWSYADRDVRLRQGDEMGRFLLGSTVVLLFRRARRCAFTRPGRRGAPYAWVRRWPSAPERRRPRPALGQSGGMRSTWPG